MPINRRWKFIRKDLKGLVYSRWKENGLQKIYVFWNCLGNQKRDDGSFKKIKHLKR